MPHKHKPRYNKAARMLVSREQVGQIGKIAEDRENIVSRMTPEAILEVKSIIQDRYDSARQETEQMAAKMEKWERLYNSEFQNTNDDEKIFLPKTREQVQTVYAYIMLLVSQLDPLVTVQPMTSTINAANEEFKRAKVAEALLNFYFKDIWKIRDDIFPKWLKNFLKFSMAVWKVTYIEDDFLPDLKVEVVDRALLYIDPTAHDLKHSRWIIQKYFMPRSEVIQMVEDGHWYIPKGEMYKIEEGLYNTPDQTLKRFYGDNYANEYSIREDDLVEIWDYWQAPRQGLDDVYAVQIGGLGGELVRYGRNPYPYKGIPFRAKSFDPHEYRPDGTGLVEQYRPFQEVINNFLNMRITDVRKNIIRPVAATGKFIDAQTQEDFQNGQKIVRLSEEVIEASKDPGFDLRKHFVELPFAPSTSELLVADLPYITGQGKESSNISDVFRGQAPATQATLGQIQEQLSRNQGVFRPIYLQVMRGFEELGEICLEYFRDPEFFPTNRIIQIIGKNKYVDTVDGWVNPGGNVFVREVSPDEMDVDPIVQAVSNADALASRTLMVSSFEQIFQSIGQIPELYQELKEQLDFPRIVEMMINHSGQDIDDIKLSPQEIQQREIRRQQEEQRILQLQQAQQVQAMQMQQAMLEMQTKLRIMEEQQKIQAQTYSQIAVNQQRIQLENSADARMEAVETQGKITEIKTKILEELKADLVKMREEARLEAMNANLSVGHGNNVNQ